MKSNWYETTLGTCVRFQNGKKRPVEGGVIPVYGGNGVLDHTNRSNNRNCVIIGRVGAYCGSVFREKGICWVSDNAISATVKSDVDIDYIYYFLKNAGLNRRHIGTSQPLLTQEILNSISIYLPSLPTQKKIAAILSALDEKIAINRAINDNLEQQAFALFDRLFPRTIDGSQTIGDYIIPKRGRNLLSKDAVYGAVPVVAGGLEPSTYHNVANTKAPVLTISASGANAGFINLWLNPVWSSDSSYIDYSMTPNVFFWYILLKGRQTEIFDAQTGSAQPHIYPQHIAAMPIGDLNQESVSQFTTQVAPLFELIGANKDENERLRNIRDTLLPKLMSGEIDVSTVQL